MYASKRPDRPVIRAEESRSRKALVYFGLAESVDEPNTAASDIGELADLRRREAALEKQVEALLDERTRSSQ